VVQDRQYAPAVEHSMMKRRSRASSFQQFLKEMGPQQTIREYQGRQTIYSQGDPADAMFYIQSGNVMLTVTSQSGKKAVIAILGRGDFFGTGCLAKQSLRRTGAAALPQASIARVDSEVFVRLIHQEPDFARLFISYLASQVGRIGEDLLDQHFSSSEQRLARVLLRLAHLGEGRKSEPAISAVSQDTLAQMVGTTRSRISHFMNKFRKLGYISYNGRLKVHGSLHDIVLHDWRSTHPGAPGFPHDGHF
jgi:CRP-like cAMP-binding protein